MNSYEALRSHSAAIDLSARGKIRVVGEDRARLLHAMSTNDVNGLPKYAGLYAFFLTAQGRIVADANIYNLGESFLLDTEPETGQKLYEHLDKFIIADDVTLEDETQSWAAIGIEGPASTATAQALLGDSMPTESLGIAAWRKGFVVKVASTGNLGFRIFVPVEDRGELKAELERLGIPQASADEARVVRLENGIPRYGDDISERYLVQETQQMQAVHFAKGCYIGQEIVERVRSRGQVHRLLTPVHVHSAEPPAPGTKLEVQGKPAGEITSAAFSPALEEVVALAYVRTEANHPGTELTVAGEQTITASVG